MKDPVFGEMSYNYEWERNTEFKLFGKNYPIQIIAQSASENESHISNVQQKAYLTFLEIFSTNENEAALVLFDYCKNTLNIPVENIETCLLNNIPTAIFFAIDGNWGILIQSNYDIENGIALVYAEQQWIAGPQDILI